MLDEMRGDWQLPDRPVVADSGYGDAAEFRQELTQRGLAYVLQIDPTATAQPDEAAPVRRPHSGRGRPPKPGYPHPARSLRAPALAVGRGAGREITWRHGSKATHANPHAAMNAQFLTIRVRPTNRNIARADDGSLPTEWLIAEWPPEADEPVKYWLSNTGQEGCLATLVRLGKIRWRVEHDYRELKHGLGMDHFEKRSFTGWHRHVTLVALAQAFCTLLRLDPKANAPA